MILRADRAGNDVERRAHPVFAQPGENLGCGIAVAVVEGEHDRPRRDPAVREVRNQIVRRNRRDVRVVEPLQLAFENAGIDREFAADRFGRHPAIDRKRACREERKMYATAHRCGLRCGLAPIFRRAKDSSSRSASTFE